MIKTAIVLSWLVLLSATASCQTLTVKDMIAKTRCKDFSCFNSFIIGKGFSYWRTREVETETYFTYLSDKKFRVNGTTDLDAPNIASFHLVKNGTVSVQLSTGAKSQYLKTLTEIAALKFKEKTTFKEDEQILSTIYESAQEPLVVIVVKIETINKDGQDLKSYEVKVMRHKQ